MKLSNKKLQDLKDKKISIKELNDRYFINSKGEAEVDNMLKLLNENVCDFKYIVDKVKSLKDKDNDPCLEYLLQNKEVFEKLIENNKLNTDDLEYLLNKIDNKYELRSLGDNTFLLQYMIDSSAVSFKELVDKYKSIKDCANNPCLYMLLENKELFEELIQNNKLTKNDLRYLLNAVDRDSELHRLCENIPLIKQYELNRLCENTLLLMKVLNEFVFNIEIVDRLNSMIEKYYRYDKGRNIHNIFDMIEDKNRNNEELLKLNKLNKKVYRLNDFNLTTDEKLELIDILKDNEIAQNTLIQIIDNHLEDTYNFDTLKNILTKDTEKKKLKMNF